MTTLQTSRNRTALLLAAALLVAGCDDAPTTVDAPTTAAAFDSDRFLSILASFDEDDVMRITRGAADANIFTLSLGGDYRARVWHPDGALGIHEAMTWAEAWGLLASFEDPDPDCEGTGPSFATCVQRLVESGLESLVQWEGDVYHAHIVMPL